MNNIPDLIVRADAGPKIGSGHAMRGLALALAWKRLGGKAELWGECPPALAERLRAAGLTTRPASDDFPRGCWAMIDGYNFGPDYLEKALKRARTLVVDDHGHRPILPATVVMNHNAGAERFRYAGDAAPLLGPRYALLRPEFSEEPRRAARDKKRVLVTMGGGEQGETLKLVLDALKPLGVEVSTISGNSVSDPRALMLDCDAAVIAGGVTALECAATALPTAILVVADNQRGQAEALAREGAAINLGEERDPKKIAAAVKKALSTPAMGAKGRALVDGKGAARVAEFLLNLKEAPCS